MKSAAVFALDVSCCDAAALEQARQICLHTGLEKMMYAPNDELGLVFAGTDATLNPLHTASGGEGGRYRHITVVRSIEKTAVDYLSPLQRLDPARPQGGVCDVLETLVVCADLLNTRTARKKYDRRIYLLTDARAEVARKTEITSIIASLRRDGVSVIVVGIGFTQAEANVEGSWSGLSTKEENERVLHYLCSSLAGTSALVGLEDALGGLGELRRRKVLQRALSKLVLTIGGARLAVQLHSKVVADKVPTLKKVTAVGEEVGQQVSYQRIGDFSTADGGGSGGGDFASGPPRDAHSSHSAGGPSSMTMMPPVGDVVKALRYGRSLIPCTEADLAAMKLKGPRGLDAVGFVRQAEIPPYITTGAARTLLPLAGDNDGQRGLACLCEAMMARSMALIVRYVSRTDAKPALGVCCPARKARSTGQYVLYYSPLPFTEDVRLYRFSEYDDIVCTAAEVSAMDSLVDAMTVEGRVLRPAESFNPEIHQYYATVKDKLLRAAAGEGEGNEETDGSACGVPELIAPLQRTSAAFTTHGNALKPLLRAAQPLLESCATAFPYVEVAGDGVGGDGAAHRGAWFNTVAAAAALSDAASSFSGGSGTPTTVAAPALAAGSTASGGAASSTSTVAATAGLASGRPDQISSIDPVGSFTAIVRACEADPNARAMATDCLADVLLSLLRNSIKGNLYGKCDDCVRALRAYCCAEQEPVYFNTVLRKLQAVAQELALGEAYWDQRIVAGGADLHPITKQECVDSDVADERAAREFMAQDRALPAADLSDDGEDDLMDLIE